jgi:hypothetical protein
MKLRWWKTAEEIRNEVLDQVRKEREEERIIEQKRIEEQKAEEEKIAEEKAKEPWVDIRGIMEDKKHGIKVDLDWNDAFVDYLRENGITGADDEIVVQKWITMLYRDLIEQQQGDKGADNGLI